MLFKNGIGENEQYVRQRWFNFSLNTTVYVVFVTALLALLSLREILPSIFVIGLNLAQFFLLYYFSYKRSGTRFLTFFMFMKVLGFIKLIQLMPLFLAQNASIVDYCLTQIDFFIIFVWFFLSFNLRTVNIKRRFERKLLKAANSITLKNSIPV